jgi:hypothetical protein
MHLRSDAESDQRGSMFVLALIPLSLLLPPAFLPASRNHGSCRW